MPNPPLQRTSNTETMPKRFSTSEVMRYAIAKILGF